MTGSPAPLPVADVVIPERDATVIGRDAGLRQIDAWLELVMQGTLDLAASGPALVIAGEPGIGKTTLWTEAFRRAGDQGWQVLSCRPAVSEAGLPHLGLADMLSGIPDEALGELPAPQRRSLDVALLRTEAGEGDLEPRAVGTALTALLANVASAAPLLLAVDDAQWLDQASARSLAFALRRLGNRRVALLAAVRAPGPGAAPGGSFAVLRSGLDHQRVQYVEVGPVTVAAMHQILRQKLGASFPRPLLLRIHRAAAGNPFYGLEIAREIQRLGAPPPGEPLPVPPDHRDLASLRLRRLPRPTRDLLAAIAAMSGASASDLDVEALTPAEQAGIVVVRPGGRVEFTHPLFGSACYSSLPEAARRALHRDLAGRAASLEERARHMALAADGPDESIAVELDRAAATASARGAADVAVELEELALRLTPPSDRQAVMERILQLAERRYFAGDPGGALLELEQSLKSLPEGEERARVLLEIGTMRWIQGDGDAGRTLMLEGLGQARTESLRARIHSRIASGADDADLALEHGEAALALLDESENPQLYSYCLHMVALFRLYSGGGADHDAIERGMRLQREIAGFDMSPVGAFWARNFDDFGTARQRLEGLIQAFREHGDEAQVCAAITHLATLEAMTGRMDLARALVAEASDLAAQTAQDTYQNLALIAVAQVSAMEGDLDRAREAAGELLDRLRGHPDVVLEGQARIVLGLAALTAGDLEVADREFTRAHQVNELVHNREPANQRFHGDYVEVVTGLGDLDRARVLVTELEHRAERLPRPWIAAIAARSRGLLSAASGDLDAALADYERALAAHKGLDLPGELGRTLLCKGRLLRRRNERQLAQQCLDLAAATFAAAGALGWHAVTLEELARARGRRGSDDQLTETERTICDMAAAGLRNHEIAARLFLSGKTVEANLSRAYRKLGVRSRTELAAAIAGTSAQRPSQA
jgi:DNA-binding CsgD family transcriptional regulator